LTQLSLSPEGGRAGPVELFSTGRRGAILLVDFDFAVSHSDCEGEGVSESGDIEWSLPYYLAEGGSNGKLGAFAVISEDLLRRWASRISLWQCISLREISSNFENGFSLGFFVKLLWISSLGLVHLL